MMSDWTHHTYSHEGADFDYIDAEHAYLKTGEYWEHTSGARVYQSKFWLRQGVTHTWKAQRVDDVPDGDDDGRLYLTQEDAREAALRSPEEWR